MLETKYNLVIQDAAHYLGLTKEDIVISLKKLLRKNYISYQQLDYVQEKNKERKR